METSETERLVVAGDGTEPLDTAVTAHRSSPDRIVFTEEGNTDGWIATDYTVELVR